MAQSFLTCLTLFPLFSQLAATPALKFRHGINFGACLAPTRDSLVLPIVSISDRFRFVTFFSFTGGRIEAAVRLPGRPDVWGLWPAIWTLGNLGQ